MGRDGRDRRDGPAGAGLALAGFLAFASAPVPAADACGPTVTVRPGDTLGRIAERCGTTLPEILRANPDLADPDRIGVGHVLALPGAVEAQAAEPAAPVPAGHRVRPGDTLAGIAARHGVRVSELLAANPRIHPRFLAVGQVLRLPGAPVAPPRGDGTVAVEVRDPAPGRPVVLTMEGLPPDARLLVGWAPVGSKHLMLTHGRTDATGAARVETRIPRSAVPGRSYRFVVEVSRGALLASEPIQVEAPPRGRTAAKRAAG